MAIVRWALFSLILWPCLGQYICPRNVNFVEEGRRCLEKCSSDFDCAEDTKFCLCDGACGLSCVDTAVECGDPGNIPNGEIIGGTCTYRYGGVIMYRCTTPGYTLNGTKLRQCRSDGQWTAAAPHCEPPSRAPMLDIMFLIDGSGSVGLRNFALVKNWVITISSRFNIADNSTRIGVVQYSHYFPNVPLDQQRYLRTEIRLGQFSNASQFNEAVERITLHRFTTYTAAALLKVIQDFQSSPRFNDSSTSKILVVLTDGQSTDSSDLADNAAEVRSQGITTYAVGVRAANLDELRIIATGDPESDERVYYVTDFSSLDQIVNELTSEIAFTGV